jgi:hypothetical protein
MLACHPASAPWTGRTPPATVRPKRGRRMAEVTIRDLRKSYGGLEVITT